MKAGIQAYIGDSLELHDLGMFNRSFSSGYVCRYCKIHYEELVNCNGYLTNDPWLPETYDRIARALENGEEIEETFSLRGSCVLNELTSFHATTTFVPDFMHDFLGVLSQFTVFFVLKRFIKTLIRFESGLRICILLVRNLIMGLKRIRLQSGSITKKFSVLKM